MSAIEADTSSEAAPAAEPHHFRRMLAIWFVLSAVGDTLFYFLAGPHIPPGTMTSSASGAQFDFNVLLIVALPVMLAVWVYMGYAVIMWRASRPGVPEPVGGPAARGNLPIQVAWIALSSVIVLSMAGFGTYELYASAGSGGGEGPAPIWTPTSATVLPVQVIAQQWRFTYRYPTFGGFETSDLMLPVGTTIEFHVTSLDVIHDFWAYQLGVKADANPEYDNVAFTTTQQNGTFTVRCDELCGIWHGAMFDYGKIVTKAQFETWATTTEAKLAPNTKLLPAYALTYTPDANGADGGYYPDCPASAPSPAYACDPYSGVQTYGATPAKS